jgi:hypothetical protein
MLDPCNIINSSLGACRTVSLYTICRITLMQSNYRFSEQSGMFTSTRRYISYQRSRVISGPIPNAGAFRANKLRPLSNVLRFIAFREPTCKTFFIVMLHCLARYFFCANDTSWNSFMYAIGLDRSSCSFDRLGSSLWCE